MKLSATMLLDGHVLIAGGNDGAQDVATAEIFDASLEVLYPIALLDTPRSAHLAVLLPHNNTVLIANGNVERRRADFSRALRRLERDVRRRCQPDDGRALRRGGRADSARRRPARRRRRGPPMPNSTGSRR